MTIKVVSWDQLDKEKMRCLVKIKPWLFETPNSGEDPDCIPNDQLESANLSRLLPD